MNISKLGLEIIKKYEGLQLKAYKALSTEEYYTIGYGHYGADVKEGMTITETQAEAYLKADCASAEKAVNAIGKGFNQNQFDALVSFTYNCGSGKLKTLCNNRTIEEIGEKIVFYNKANGKVLTGLVRRREEEQTLYKKVYSSMTVNDSKGKEVQEMIVINAYSKAKDGNTKLSQNFKVKEFACKDGSDPIFIAPELVKILQSIRTHFGKTVTINSAYRTANYNKKVGGATYSQHCYGTAADIKVSGVSPKKVAEYAETLLSNKGGIGIYSSFTHIDVREVKSRWNG